MDRLDQSLEGIETIQDLIDHPDRLDRYYSAVNEFYRDSIPRERFDLFIDQIRVLNAADPEIGRRLLRKEEKPTRYEIKTDLKTYGRTMGKPFQDLIASLRAASVSYDQARNTLSSVSEEIALFERNLVGSRKEREAAQGEFFRAIKARPEFQQAAQRVNSDLLMHNPKLLDYLTNKGPDLALYAADQLYPKAVEALDLPVNVKSLIRDQMPRLSNLLKERESGMYFPYELRKNNRGKEYRVPASPAKTFVVRSFSRPIHAVWKGIYLKECVGGGNEYPTPRRWGTVLLNGSENFAIEAEDSYLGFMQELGYRFKDKPGNYYATEFGTPELRNDVIVKNPETGEYESTTLFDLWLKQAPKGRPRIKSGSNAINNARVSEAWEPSRAWNFGRREPLGVAKDFVLADSEMAGKLIEMSKRFSFEPTHQYGNAMITDLENRDSPESLKVSYLSHIEVNPEVLSKPSLTEKKKADLLVSYVADGLKSEEEIVAAIRKAWLNHAPLSRERTLERLSLLEQIEARIGTLPRNPGIAKLAARTLTQDDFKTLTSQDRADFLKRFLYTQFSLGRAEKSKTEYPTIAALVFEDPGERKLADLFSAVMMRSNEGAIAAVDSRTLQQVLKRYRQAVLFSAWVEKRKTTLTPKQVKEFSALLQGAEWEASGVKALLFHLSNDPSGQVAKKAREYLPFFKEVASRGLDRDSDIRTDELIERLLSISPVPREFEKVAAHLLQRMAERDHELVLNAALNTLSQRAHSAEMAQSIIRASLAAAEKSKASWIVQLLAQYQAFYKHGMYPEVFDRMMKDAVAMNDQHILLNMTKIPSWVSLDSDYHRKLLAASLNIATIDRAQFVAAFKAGVDAADGLSGEERAGLRALADLSPKELKNSVSTQALFRQALLRSARANDGCYSRELRRRTPSTR